MKHIYLILAACFLLTGCDKLKSYLPFLKDPAPSAPADNAEPGAAAPSVPATTAPEAPPVTVPKKSDASKRSLTLVSPASALEILPELIFLSPSQVTPELRQQITKGFQSAVDKAAFVASLVDLPAYDGLASLAPSKGALGFFAYDMAFVEQFDVTNGTEEQLQALAKTYSEKNANASFYALKKMLQKNWQREIGERPNRELRLEFVKELVLQWFNINKVPAPLEVELGISQNLIPILDNVKVIEIMTKTLDAASNEDLALLYYIHGHRNMNILQDLRAGY